MKTALKVIGVVLASLLWGWCIGCVKPKPAPVATAPWPCPAGSGFVQFEPRKVGPGGELLPERPLHGGDGKLLRIALPSGVLVCRTL